MMKIFLRDLVRYTSLMVWFASSILLTGEGSTYPAPLVIAWLLSTSIIAIDIRCNTGGLVR